MRDEESRSQWLHYTGECIQGEHAGSALPMLPTTLTSWKAFRALHPTGTTIDRESSWWRRLAGRIAGARDMALPFGLPPLFTNTMRARDTRLKDNELGLGVVLGQRSLLRRTSALAARFYPFKAFKQQPLVHDTLGDVPLVLAWDAVAHAVAAFDTRLDGSPLRLRLDDQHLVDEGSGARFDLVGRCVQGAFKGQRLAAMPGLSTRWYGFSQTYPNTTIYAPVSAT